ncbi:MAG: hypothetical protein ACYC6M_03085 [Terriglobales bacterium]
MSVTVGFSTGKNSIISKLIREADGVPYSHAFFLYDSTEFRCKMLLEEDHGGPQQQPLDLFRQSNDLIEVWTPNESIDAVLAATLPIYGYGYDYTGLAGEALLKIRAKLEHSKTVHGHNPLHSARTLFCSAFVCAGLEAIELAGFPKDWPPDVTPKFLHGLLEPLGAFSAPAAVCE